ncbi:putative lyase [Helianthus annuus]|uniref:Lyase n=1 Tax=Helianthus annuus TaxID=4232 RepID=A0A251S028_HELAN|nr:alpha-copaene synthase-like [Helianthus annuus]KAF5796740.1 putative lyase [Helianthus annuus]KAJ0540019.1 putative lyase [Helianthus annuus]KAJ0548400.1 putative lyase [Helianthus annuus]KAJ0554757.1 putative lyase [Helianthus annuus]KAJ0720324.1 putative lyase [Helianthus annuus]
MATAEANIILQANTQSTVEPVRPLVNFPPSIWGDRFLSFSLDNAQLEAHGKAMDQLKEQVRGLILNTAIDSNEKLSLIYSIYRLGLTYLFSKDIDSQLDKLFDYLKVQSYHDADLYTLSIHFKVFRNFGYKFSCDVFNKFKDCSSGEFKEDITMDVKGLISFYESTQLRIRGESILDEAIEFTETRLKTIQKTLQPGTLARQVKHVLEGPYNRGHPMLDARQYLVNFEEEISRFDSLLTLAKVHFNYLQLLQKNELGIISKWWKDTDLQVKMPYVRDRVPELYVWILAMFLKPCYSQARIITTKILLLVLVLHDTYDAYATLEESRLLTSAINRWDMINAMSQLPEYIKPFYETVLNEYAEFNKLQPQQGTLTSNIIGASKKAFQELARSYHQRVEWRHGEEVPSFKEYMKIGLTCSTYGLLCKSALIGMGKIVTQEALAWYESYPKIISATELIGRIEADVAYVKFKHERGPSATSVDAYMKAFMVSENVAVEAVNKMVKNAWNDLNEECLKPTEVPMDLLTPIVNLARMNNVVYRYDDGFTYPENTFKEYIALLFFVPVPM